ncbi:MAG: radical SAM protein [Deltaproteobacteria bacterium]|nr:radical SAM protein [Deltaproteobacteria bacterium]
MEDIILLIRPHAQMLDPDYDDGTGLRATSARGNQEYQPLGICYLAGMLKKHHFNVKCFDFHTPAETVQDMLRFIKQGTVKFIGIYVLISDVHAIARLIKLIRQNCDVPIVLGGPTVTHYPQTVKELHADYGLRGDAEYSMLALSRFVLNHEGGLKSIAGIVHYKGAEPYVAEPVVISDLDELPFPDFSVLPDSSHYKFPMLEGKIAVMASSRGCPFNCLFCGLTQKKKFKYRSPENVVAELQTLANEGYRYVDFRDDCFTANQERIKEICRLMIEKKLNIMWGVETRIDCVDDDLLELMAKSGCHNIRFGIETIVPRVKKVVNETSDLGNLEHVIKKLKQLRVFSVAYFLIGHPTETIDEIRQTLDFVAGSNFDIVDINMCQIFPGADLFDLAKKEGMIGDDYLQGIIATGKIPMYIPRGLNFDELQRLKKRTMLKFYLRPRNMINFLRRIKSLRDLARQFSVAVELVAWNLFGLRFKDSRRQ